MDQNLPDELGSDGTPAQRLSELVTSSWMAQAANVAAELRLADLLADGPLSVERLADLTGASGPALGRLLRALTTIDLCRQHADGSFEMTQMGSLLAADAPDSLRAWTLWWGKHLWPVWGQLLYSVRTGQSARKLLLGTDGFEHLQNWTTVVQSSTKPPSPNSPPAPTVLGEGHSENLVDLIRS